MKQKLLAFALITGKPFTYLAARWLKFVKTADPNGKHSDKTFMKLGVLPVLDHYYQPLINPRKHLRKSLREDRALPGIDMNVSGQLSLLEKFNFNEELLQFPSEKGPDNDFYYKNGAFESGDAEYLYNMIRHFKPARMVEIGSGSSTLMAYQAFVKNKAENSAYSYKLTCIEPYEQPWLEKLGAEVIRQKAETVDMELFTSLGKNDILFIDSSHIIRPQGDVLFEYLEVLPLLKPGVIVHVHDIFTPKDYPGAWVYNHVLWNEQYLLEAFLSFNNKFRIIGALNYLCHHHREAIARKCPVFAQDEKREAGSFWMVRLED